MNHIELFAGCGGLSLGLEAAGFELLMANELSPMAAETFAFNHLGVDLTTSKNPKGVFWISSQFARSELQKRLRESPIEAAGLDKEKFTDLSTEVISPKELKRSLLVGSIIDLNLLLERSKGRFLKLLRSAIGGKGVDLVSGGPPCQSFSLAGLREHNNHRNSLPLEFAKFVDFIKPKIALLENVSGILSAFDINGKKFYAWREVASVFSQIGYVPICIHINAKRLGVPQNRPRYIMLAVREDVCKQFLKKSNDKYLLSIVDESYEAFTKASEENKGNNEGFVCFDFEKDTVRNKYNGGVLRELTAFEDQNYVSVKEAIDDLSSKSSKESEYVKEINRLFAKKDSNELNKSVLNHELRANGPVVMARNRLYQVSHRLEKNIAQNLKKMISMKIEPKLSSHEYLELSKFWLLDLDGKKQKNLTKKGIERIIQSVQSKKHSQKALHPQKPSPAVLGSPDDTCHYAEKVTTLRTLTVRELARIQSFPDWFEFRSKVTTGGQYRRYEVPQYTQVGNAVPPILGAVLGKICTSIIEAK